MKNSLFPILFLATVFSFNLQGQSASDEADMKTFARNFETAFNQEHLGAIEEMFTEHAVFIDQESKQMTGRDEIAAYFAEQFRLDDATLSLHQFELNWSDREHAWVAGGNFEIYGNTSEFDFEIPEIGEYSNVMVNYNGRWEIAWSEWTPLGNMPPATPSEKVTTN